MRTRATICGFGIAILSIGTWLVSSVQGAGVDRDYTFGDDPLENAQNGMSVGSGSGADGTTFDSEGTFGDGSLVDLIANGFPVYDNSTTSRPLGGSGLGIRFDGVDDYLNNERLGLPETSFSAAGGDNAGPLDYAGLANRGFQLWVNPSSAGSSNGFAQSIVADTNQHGVRISDSDTWVMRYAGTDVDSGVAVDFDQWSHVMVVRPFGTTGPTSGSRLYVDGVAIAGAGGGYTGADDTNLVVGASTGDVPGTADFFTGILDDLELFVLGTTTSDPPTVYGDFDAAVDNEWIANELLGVDPADVDLDGNVDGDDITAFLPTWETQFLVDGVQVGDWNSRQNGDLNIDGIVDLDDVFILHNGLRAAGSLNGFPFELLGGTEVPEPSTVSLLVALGFGLVVAQSRRLS